MRQLCYYINLLSVIYQFRLFLILKKNIILFEKKYYFIFDKIYFSLSYIFFFMGSDKVLSCHTFMLQRAPQMLQCTPPTCHISLPFLEGK